ncbi:MAG: winged helix DNA-binding domain-containing protein, partial [Anaerolineales bacterium]|nr:winged helix DNA-binding domain-containing protein [Anaerolineales bacterium]
MDVLKITPQEARRTAVAAQRLAGPYPADTKDNLLDLMQQIRCLQLDPIRAVERTQYLVLWSRLGQYSRDHLHQLLYEDRHLFEYWAHAAS